MMKYVLCPIVVSLQRHISTLTQGIACTLAIILFSTTLLFTPAALTAMDVFEFEGKLADKCVEVHRKDAEEGCYRGRMPCKCYDFNGDPPTIKMVVNKKQKKATITPEKIKLQEVFKYRKCLNCVREINQITDFSINFSPGKVGDKGTIEGTYQCEWFRKYSEEAEGEKVKSLTSKWKAVPGFYGYLIYLDHDTTCSSMDNPWFILIGNMLPNILLEKGEQVPECLNDASIWQEWIEQRAANRQGNRQPGYDKVAEVFKDVAEKFEVSGDRRIFWQGALVMSCLETGFYTFMGDADPEDCNVAGVGIQLSDDPRKLEDYRPLPRGIKAFYQHLALYATGELKPPDTLIAEKTKKTQKGKTVHYVQKRLSQGYRITFNDLKAPLPKNVELSVEFATFVKFAGSMGWDEAKRRLDGTGGTTLGWAGDPFYGVKQMDLGREGTKWVMDRYEQKNKSARAVSSCPSCPERPAGAVSTTTSSEPPERIVSTTTSSKPPERIVPTTTSSKPPEEPKPNDDGWTDVLEPPSCGENRRKLQGYIKDNRIGAIRVYHNKFLTYSSSGKCEYPKKLCERAKEALGKRAKDCP